MNKFSLNSYSSIEWLKAGKILVHPTESIWGLGCDAFNEKAVDKIFKIKKRKRNKNFILLSESLNSVKKYVKQINKKIELEVICENINQDNEIFWNSRIRKSEKGGGAGKMKILNGTGKYKKFIGLTCPYGVNYKKNYAWFKAKCKIEN